MNQKDNNGSKPVSPPQENIMVSIRQDDPHNDALARALLAEAAMIKQSIDPSQVISGVMKMPTPQQLEGFPFSAKSWLPEEGESEGGPSLLKASREERSARLRSTCQEQAAPDSGFSGSAPRPGK